MCRRPAVESLLPMIHSEESFPTVFRPSLIKGPGGGTDIHRMGARTSERAMVTPSVSAPYIRLSLVSTRSAPREDQGRHGGSAAPRIAPTSGDVTQGDVSDAIQPHLCIFEVPVGRAAEDYLARGKLGYGNEASFDILEPLLQFDGIQIARHWGYWYRVLRRFV